MTITTSTETMIDHGVAGAVIRDSPYRCSVGVRDDAGNQSMVFTTRQALADAYAVLEELLIRWPVDIMSFPLEGE